MDKEDFTQIIDGMDRIMDKHADDLQTLFKHIIDDMIDSYNVLIHQREQTIDKYINIVAFMLQDEKNISKPIQSMVEKKLNDVAELKQEMELLKEFQEVMLSDEIPTDEQGDELINKFKNINW